MRGNTRLGWRWWAVAALLAAPAAGAQTSQVEEVPAEPRPAQSTPDQDSTPFAVEERPHSALAGFDSHTLESIDVRGNTRTRSETVVAYSRLHVGKALPAGELERVERRLVATGLFKDVRVLPTPAGVGRVRLVLEVHDKASWVVAPTFAIAKGNIGGGVLYAENNLWGRSKKFAAAAQYTTADSGLFVGYMDPNLFGWPALRFSAEGQLRSDRVEEYALGSDTQDDPQVQRRTRINSIGAAGELTVEWFERVRTAAKYRVTLLDPKEPSGPLADAQAFEAGPARRDSTLRLMVGIDTRQNLHAVMEGLNLEGSYELSDPSVGSQFRYRRYGLLYRQGVRVFDDSNFVVRGEAAMGNDLPFHAELTLGGANQRGFLHRQFRGDTRASFTAEFHFPLFTVSSVSVRGVGFSDSGVALWRELPADGLLRDETGRVMRGYLPGAQSGLDGATFTQGVGGGLRLYLRSIVLPLLGVDAAYGLNSGEFRFYIVAGVNPT